MDVTQLQWALSHNKPTKIKVPGIGLSTNYWVFIKAGNKIVGRVCGRNEKEAETTALYICDMHNHHLSRQ